MLLSSFRFTSGNGACSRSFFGSVLLLFLPLCFLLHAVPARGAAPATIPGGTIGTIPGGTADATALLPAPDQEEDSAGQTGTPSAPDTERLFTLVQARASMLAGRSYKNNTSTVPAALLALDLAEWESIRFKPEYAPWQGEALPFSLSFFAPGSIYNRSVTVNLVENGDITPLRLSGDMFDFDATVPLDAIATDSFPCAGFSLTQLPPFPAEPREVAAFLGATYFRAHGKNAVYGLSARGLALNTALPEGEEFPYFQEFWLVKPQAGDTAFTLYALMDSPSMTGAYAFVITPGTSTVIDTRCRLFPRGDSTRPAKIGLAAMNSMFLTGETGEPGEDGAPHGVHSSDGLLIRSRHGEWSWRPLANPARLTVSAFPMQDPVGFGLMQRDGDFTRYQDIRAAYDRQPSLWVEAVGEWGAGHMELVEIPTKNAIHSNIYAYWVPASPSSFQAPPAPPHTTGEPDRNSGEAAPASPGGQPRDFAYRLYWQDAGVTPHSLGRVARSRVIRSPAADSARFILDFDGETIRSLPEDTGLTSIVETPEQAPLLDKQLLKDPETGLWRLDFTVRLPRQDGVMQTIIAAREGVPHLRFKVRLKKGENIPAPLTETWVFDLPLQ
ncbi:glucan biosynthesis protein [Desulfovibrio sp. OttesenSCG-928-I05]|nr:glucan biosynthesis protein [Desulfovibrio sp. OttesenSCG-928-I05]